MPDPINLTVQEDEAIQLSAEEIRVVEAVSPTVTTEQIEGGAVITVTDLRGVHAVTVYNGADGRGIANAVLNADYTLTITYTDGTSYTTPSIRGERGAGITSIIKTGTSGPVDTYTITYGDGQTATFFVTNGADGFSPTVTVEPITGGYRITITDKNGPHTFDISNGTNGDNGVSPSVTVTDISGGHRVTITDAEHPNGQTFDVMNGTVGPGVAAGGTQGQMLVKKSGTDYDTEWQNQPSVPVQDVQVNGNSIVNQGVADIEKATDAQVKAGSETGKMLVPSVQDSAAFYGLAKAAGDSTQAASSNAVGTYTEDAKKKIRMMLGIPNQQWEPIVEYIVPEDSAQVNIDADANGQPFKLSNILVKAWLKPSTTGTQDYVSSNSLTVKTDDSNSMVSSPTIRYMGNGAATYMEYETKICSNNLIADGRGAAVPGSTSNLLRISSANNDMKYIRGFRLSQYNGTSTLIPKDTVIKIYGIRIDE